MIDKDVFKEDILKAIADIKDRGFATFTVQDVIDVLATIGKHGEPMHALIYTDIFCYMVKRILYDLAYEGKTIWWNQSDKTKLIRCPYRCSNGD